MWWFVLPITLTMKKTHRILAGQKGLTKSSILQTFSIPLHGPLQTPMYSLSRYRQLVSRAYICITNWIHHQNFNTSHFLGSVLMPVTTRRHTNAKISTIWSAWHRRHCPRSSAWKIAAVAKLLSRELRKRMGHEWVDRQYCEHRRKLPCSFVDFVIPWSGSTGYGTYWLYVMPAISYCIGMTAYKKNRMLLLTLCQVLSAVFCLAFWQRLGQK